MKSICESMSGVVPPLLLPSDSSESGVFSWGLAASTPSLRGRAATGVGGTGTAPGGVAGGASGGPGGGDCGSGGGCNREPSLRVVTRAVTQACQSS